MDKICRTTLLFGRLLKSTLKAPISTEIGPSSHFSLFPTSALEDELDHDGYQKVALSFNSRMWAGGKIQFATDNPLAYGQEVTKSSRITNQTSKMGSRGMATFETTENTISNKFGISLVEEQNLVYLQNKLSQVKSIKCRYMPDFSRTVHPTTVTLFRFSALTFNSHKIHYDLEYAKKEGYSKLLVHGPLTCSLLLELFQLEFPSFKICSFEYSAIAPLFVDAPIVLGGKMFKNSCRLWATNQTGDLAMTGTLVYKS